MKNLPKTVTQSMYICMGPHSDKPELCGVDMSGYGFANLGTIEVTFDVPQTDPRAAYVAGLEAQAEKLRADHHVEITRIQDQIQQLLAIESDGGGS